MRGLIKEKNWVEIERVFPGIHSFYDHLEKTPKTFLDLEQEFLDEFSCTDDSLLAEYFHMAELKEKEMETVN